MFLAGLLTSIQNLFSIKIRANTSHESISPNLSCLKSLSLFIIRGLPPNSLVTRAYLITPPQQPAPLPMKGEYQGFTSFV